MSALLPRHHLLTGDSDRRATFLLCPTNTASYDCSQNAPWGSLSTAGTQTHTFERVRSAAPDGYSAVKVAKTFTPPKGGVAEKQGIFVGQILVLSPNGNDAVFGPLIIGLGETFREPAIKVGVGFKSRFKGERVPFDHNVKRNQNTEECAYGQCRG